MVLADGARRAGDSFVIGFDELRGVGADRLLRDPDAVDERSRQVRPDDVATIVYTSGTSGPPKGAMISHANIMWTLRCVAPAYDLGEGERLLSFLPLSHIAERMMSDFMPIAVAGETWFARSLTTVAEDLPACRPTAFFAVPRVWEKLRQGIEDHVRTQALPVSRRRWSVTSPWACAMWPLSRTARPRPGPPSLSTKSWTGPSGRPSANSSGSIGPTSWSPRRRPPTRTSSAGSAPWGCL